MMKKYIICLLLFFVSMSSIAQEWTTRKYEADELKGTPACSAYFYIDRVNNKTYHFGFNDFQNSSIYLDVKEIFDYSYNHDTKQKSVNALIGYYSENKKLMEKEQITFVYDGEYGEYFRVYSHDAEKLIKYVSEENLGYVRIIIQRYMNSDFEITIPTLALYLEQIGKP